MNIKFETLRPTYRTPVSAPRKKHAPASSQAKESYGNYDTVTINGPQTNQNTEVSFARALARTAASQIPEGASPERVQELKSQIAAGTYRRTHSRLPAVCLAFYKRRETIYHL